MITTHPPKTSVDFKNFSSKYVGIGPPSYMSPSVVDIPLVSCVCESAISATWCFISAPWAEVEHWFPDEFRGRSLCLMSSECTEISSHWQPNCPPPQLQSWNMVISHSCCVKLVFLCGCDKHMAFCEERSLKTPNRDRSFFFILRNI